MKLVYALIILLFFASCSKKETADLTVNLTIEGLKKGTVYLYKNEDTIPKMLDSITVSGQPELQLTTDLEEPEMLYLIIDKNSNTLNELGFFAEKGSITINTTLKNFNLDAKISGSKTHDLLQTYYQMMSKFNNKNLDLIKEQFETYKAGDSLESQQKQIEIDNLLKRKYLYTINFAVTNNDSEVSPYLALTEIYDANIKYLDTINQKLTPKIRASLYGKALEEFIKKRKSIPQ